MEVVDYENTVEVPLNVADINNAWASTFSNIPWVNSPMIDANVSVNNLPEWEDITPDLVWRSTDIVWSASDSDTVARTEWTIKLADWTSYSVDAGNTGNISAINYIYYDWTSTLKKTTTPQDAVWLNKLLVCVAKNETSPKKATFQPFWTTVQNTFITADNIAANTITANEIASNTITATQISSSYVYAWTIDADNITSWTITGRTLQTWTSWQRVIISSSNNRIDFYNSDWVSSGQIAWWKVWSTQVLALSSSWYIYSWATHLTQHLYPLSDASYNLWASTLWYKNIYITWVLDFDDWDWQLSEVSWYPKRSANWWSTYFIPLLTWASTNKTTNASIIMDFGWTKYYVNVLAV
jgi:hypothetical protein